MKKVWKLSFWPSLTEHSIQNRAKSALFCYTHLARLVILGCPVVSLWWRRVKPCAAYIGLVIVVNVAGLHKHVVACEWCNTKYTGMVNSSAIPVHHHPRYFVSSQELLWCLRARPRIHLTIRILYASIPMFLFELVRNTQVAHALTSVFLRQKKEGKKN